MSPEALKKLALALAQARHKSARKEDLQPGIGTNEAGPPVLTNKTPDEWPTDG